MHNIQLIVTTAAEQSATTDYGRLVTTKISATDHISSFPSVTELRAVTIITAEL